MKRILLLCFLIVLFASVAFADCDVTVQWTPSADPNAAEEELWYDPDNTVPGDEYMAGGAWAIGTVTEHTFQITVAGPNDEVYIRTYNAARTDVAETSRVPVGGLVPGSILTVTTVCMP